ncbi:MAG: hypothetical protein H8E38_07970 [SAR324 cluster bacterium]|nr:hypothetical protein [SAR324 cluster bacterium]MBL7035945.1 hypothetical protein [SAR324 cluster bacterium]
MFFTAPDHRRKRERRTVLSWKIKIILLFVLVFFHGVVAAAVNGVLEFSDNDSRGGWLRGDLIFTVTDEIVSAKKSEQVEKYVLYWGNNPHQRLGMFLPIVVLPVAESGSRMKIQFKDTRIPQGATHFLLYVRYQNGEETEKYSLSLVDKGVPQSKPQAIVFEQTAKEGNRVKGVIKITRAWDERDVSHYTVYWGSSNDTVLRAHSPVLVIEKRYWFSSLSTQLQAPWQLTPLQHEIDMLLPPEATHLLVFSRNAEGQMSQGVSTELESEIQHEQEQTQNMFFKKEPADLGMIAGTISFIRPEEESDSSHYLFFWGKDELSRLESVAAITQFEINKFRDGLTEKEIQVSTLSKMDQDLQVKSAGEAGRKLSYKFPESTVIPPDASHFLVFTQQKFWFQDDAERRLKGPIASVSIQDPGGKKKKKIIKSKIKAGLENFSIEQYNKQVLSTAEKTDNLDISLKTAESKADKIRKASDWRISEYRGLGIGLSFSGLNGLVTFYDYNLDHNVQLHYALELTGPQIGNTFKALRLTEESTAMQSIAKSGSGNSLEINRSILSATYRWFVDESIVWGITEGFYYGAGGGLGYATLKYQGKDASATASISGESEDFNSTATDYLHSAKAYGLFAVLDAGWQGLENYYFQFALQPTIYFYYKDSYQESSIPVNPNQRSTVNERWSSAKNLTRVLLGFGIFF